MEVAIAVTGGFAFSTTFTGVGTVTTSNDIRVKRRPRIQILVTTVRAPRRQLT